MLVHLITLPSGVLVISNGKESGKKVLGYYTSLNLAMSTIFVGERSQKQYLIVTGNKLLKEKTDEIFEKIKQFKDIG